MRMFRNLQSNGIFTSYLKRTRSPCSCFNILNKSGLFLTVAPSPPTHLSQSLISFQHRMGKNHRLSSILCTTFEMWGLVQQGVNFRSQGIRGGCCRETRAGCWASHTGNSGLIILPSLPGSPGSRVLSADFHAQATASPCTRRSPSICFFSRIKADFEADSSKA